MFEKMKNGLASRLSPTGEHLSALGADFKSRLRGFKSNRAPSQQRELQEDFALLLEAWGISEADIPGLMRELRLRCLIFVLPVAVAACVALSTQRLVACLTLALIAPPCLLGVVTALWRISILKNRAFTPLFRRLTRGFTRKHP